MNSERALLVATGGGIGDTLLAGVVARALHTRYAHVDALVLPAHRDLATRIPDIGAVDVFDGSVFEVAQRLRAQRYDAAVVTWATLQTALVPFLAGIPVRVGQARRLYSALFTARVAVRSEAGDRTTHWTQILLDYARAIGCDVLHATPAFEPTDDDRAAAAALLAQHAISGPYALLHATRGLSADHARWPIVGFVELMRALARREHVPLLLSGSPADAPIVQAIAAAAGGAAISIAGETSIGAFGALASGARYVLAMDSGPMHVAAAVGAPTVGIFALQSDEPERWAPLGRATAVVRASYPCPPQHRKETCPNFACVRELDVGAILAALDGLLPTPAEIG